MQGPKTHPAHRAAVNNARARRISRWTNTRPFECWTRAAQFLTELKSCRPAAWAGRPETPALQPLFLVLERRPTATLDHATSISGRAMLHALRGAGNRAAKCLLDHVEKRCSPALLKPTTRRTCNADPGSHRIAHREEGAVAPISATEQDQRMTTDQPPHHLSPGGGPRCPQAGMSRLRRRHSLLLAQRGFCAERRFPHPENRVCRRPTLTSDPGGQVY